MPCYHSKLHHGQNNKLPIATFGAAKFKMIVVAIKNMFKQRPCGHLPEIAALYENADRVSSEIKDFQSRINVLLNDVKKCTAWVNHRPKNQFWRRTLIRSLFALIDAFVYGLKRIALLNYSLYEVNFSQADLALLHEQKYVLKDNGEAMATDGNYPQFLPNLKFSFRAFAKSHGSNFSLNTDGLSKLSDLMQVRHQITHPKKASELNISDAHLKLVEDVWKWLSAEWVQLARDCLPNRNQPREVERVLSRIPISKTFTLLCANGDVYEFATRKDLLAFTSTHKSSKNINRAMALSFRSGEWRIIREGKFS
jgi:hypothetical protein